MTWKIIHEEKDCNETVYNFLLIDHSDLFNIDQLKAGDLVINCCGFRLHFFMPDNQKMSSYAFLSCHFRLPVIEEYII